MSIERAAARLLLSGLTLTGVACGGTSVGAADVQRFDSLVVGVSSAVSTYRTQAAAATDTVSCNSAETSYDGQVRPMVQQMGTMAGAMDGYMQSNGRMMDGDMECSTGGMMAELDGHTSIACMSSMSVNQAEAQRHVDAMGVWGSHMQARLGEMGSMMNGGMMGGSQVGACVREADGGYTLP